jgi:hypothetical protein
MTNRMREQLEAFALIERCPSLGDAQPDRLSAIIGM